MNLELVVKNTFWDFTDPDLEALKKTRARSEPPRPNKMSFSEHHRFAEKCRQAFHGAHGMTHAEIPIKGFSEQDRFAEKCRQAAFHGPRSKTHAFTPFKGFSEQDRFAEKCGQALHGSRGKTQAGTPIKGFAEQDQFAEKCWRGFHFLHGKTLKKETLAEEAKVESSDGFGTKVTFLAPDLGHMKLGSQLDGHLALGPTASWPDIVLKQSPSGNAPKPDSHVNSSLSGSCHWWRLSRYTCPLCDFPIRLLPFPPFKFPVGGGRNVLVDGQFLAVQVLSSWNFKVLGRMLTREDIQALDTYVKSRRLCCSLLSDAIALMQIDDLESQAELARMRAAAQDKLELLKRMKRTRLSRLSAEHP